MEICVFLYRSLKIQWSVALKIIMGIFIHQYEWWLTQNYHQSPKNDPNDAKRDIVVQPKNIIQKEAIAIINGSISMQQIAGTMKTYNKLTEKVWLHQDITYISDDLVCWVCWVCWVSVWRYWHFGHDDWLLMIDVDVLAIAGFSSLRSSAG